MIDGRFEWDNEKAIANLAKHRVSFDFAKLVFDDTFAVDVEDLRFEYDEFRAQIIGLAGEVLVSVSYTIRQDRVRIISARRATASEARLYGNERE